MNRKIPFARFSFLAALLSAVLFFSACSGSGKQALMVPEDAEFVVNVNVASLSKKGDLQNIDDLKIVKQLLGDLKEDDPQLHAFVDDIMKDPQSVGIDLKQDILVFGTDLNDREDAHLVVAATLRNGDKFHDFLLKMKNKLDVDVNIDKAKEYKMAFLDEDEACFVWNKKLAYLAIPLNRHNEDVLRDYVADLIEMGKEETMASNKQFKEYWNARSEVSAWLPMGPLFDNFANDMYGSQVEEIMDVYENAGMTMAFNFLKGSIAVDMNVVGEIDKGMLKMADQKFNTQLLNYMPDNALLAASQAFNIDKMIEYYGKVDEFNDLLDEEVDNNVSVRELISCLGGSVVVAMSDIHTDENILPLFSLAFDLREAAPLKKVMRSSGLEFDRGRCDLSEMVGFPLSLVVNDDVLVLTTDMSIARSAAKGGGSKGLKNIDGAISKGGYLFVDLNVAHYPNELISEMPSELVSLLKGYCSSLELVGNGKMSSRLSLYLVNKEDNSLSFTLRYLDKNADKISELANSSSPYDDYEWMEEDEWDTAVVEEAVEAVADDEWY